MYAIIKLGGRQWKVEPKMVLDVPRLDKKIGATLTIDDVLLFRNDKKTVIGDPSVKGVHVMAKVVEHIRGPKMLILKMKKRKRYRRRQGYRDALTRLRITDIKQGS